MNIATVIGARPQFIKASVLSKLISESVDCSEVIIHTGQHYNDEMLQIFFDELELPTPDYNLEVGSGNHGFQTGKILSRVEEVLIDEKPDITLVYGDTDSTLAGALSASKLHIPVVHVESGLRSFNIRMPEDVNRILTDHISDLLFAPTDTAVQNLINEGINTQIIE